MNERLRNYWLCLYWQSCQICVLVVQMKKKSFKESYFFNCFRTLGVALSVSGVVFWRFVQKVIFVSKRVFWKDDEFLVVQCCLICEFDREIFIIPAKNFCVVLRTALHVSTGLFWGKNWFNKNPFTYFFRTLSGKLIKIWRMFFGQSVKKTINACRGAFGGKDNYWVKPCQSWHKLLAWVSVLLSTWGEEPIDQRNAWIIF